MASRRVDPVAEYVQLGHLLQVEFLQAALQPGAPLQPSFCRSLKALFSYCSNVASPQGTRSSSTRLPLPRHEALVSDPGSALLACGHTGGFGSAGHNSGRRRPTTARIFITPWPIGAVSGRAPMMHRPEGHECPGQRRHRVSVSTPRPRSLTRMFLAFPRSSASSPLGVASRTRVLCDLQVLGRHTQ